MLWGCAGALLWCLCTVAHGQGPPEVDVDDPEETALTSEAEPRVHIYGPAGHRGRREVFAVVEGADGQCIAAAESVPVTAENAEVEELPSAGHCVRRYRVSGRRRQRAAQLRFAVGSTELDVGVPLGESVGLELEVQRRGNRIVATVPRSATPEVWLIDGSGRRPMERQGRRRFVAESGADAVAVLARRGEVLGVAGVAPANPEAASVVMVPTGTAIEAGGEPREAVLLLAFDRRGRPSRTLPISITSERGQLRQLRWLSRGVAAISLAAEAGIHSVDLQVGLRRQRLGALELPVIAGWPEDAELRIAGRLMQGQPFRVLGNLAGAHADQVEFGIVCGDGEPVPPGAQCTFDVPEGVVSLVARVDERWIPLRSHVVHLSPPPMLAEEGEQGEPGADAEDALAPDESSPRSLRWTVALSGIAGQHGRHGGGLALGLERWWPFWRVGGGLLYGLRRIRAEGQGNLSSLSMVRHEAMFFVEGAASWGNTWRGEVGVQALVGMAMAVGSIGDTDASGTAPSARVRASVGLVRRDDGRDVRVSLFGSLGTDMADDAWGAALWEIGLEVGVALPL